MRRPASRAPTAPRVSLNLRHAALDAAVVRAWAARNHYLDNERRRASGHRRALVSVWLQELARR